MAQGLLDFKGRPAAAAAAAPVKVAADPVAAAERQFEQIAAEKKRSKWCFESDSNRARGDTSLVC